MPDLRFTYEINPTPVVPGVPVEAKLYDRQAAEPSRPIGRGTGATLEAALLSLWEDLRDSGAPDAALALIEGSYFNLTGKMPLKP